VTGNELEKAIDRVGLTPLQLARMAGSSRVATVYGKVPVASRATRNIAALEAFLIFVPRDQWPIDCPRRTKVSGPRRIRSSNDPRDLVRTTMSRQLELSSALR
jgi:hypothetical protein